MGVKIISLITMFTSKQQHSNGLDLLNLLLENKYPYVLESSFNN